MEMIDFILKEVVLLVGLYGLLSIFLCYIISIVCKAFKMVSRGKYYASMFGLMFGTMMVGGTKTDIPTAQIYWDEGLRDAGTAIDTNDLRQITFKWSYEDWVPSVATVSGYAWDNTAGGVPTDFEGSIPIFSNVPVTDRQAIVMMEQDATNYVYYVEQSYIPDAPVVTNGVYHIHAVGTNKVWIPIGLTIKEDSRIISPHKEKQ